MNEKQQQVEAGTLRANSNVGKVLQPTAPVTQNSSANALRAALVRQADFKQQADLNRMADSHRTTGEIAKDTYVPIEEAIADTAVGMPLGLGIALTAEPGAKFLEPNQPGTEIFQIPEDSPKQYQYAPEDFPQREEPSLRQQAQDFLINKAVDFSDWKHERRDALNSPKYKAQDERYRAELNQKQQSEEYQNAGDMERILLAADYTASALMDNPLIAADTALGAVGDIFGSLTGAAVARKAASTSTKRAIAKNDRALAPNLAAIDNAKPKPKTVTEDPLTSKLKDADEKLKQKKEVVAKHKAKEQAILEKGEAKLKAAGAAGFGLSMAGQEGGSNAVAAVDEIEKMSHTKLMESDTYRDEYLRSGGDKNKAKKKLQGSVGSKTFAASAVGALIIGKVTGATSAGAGVLDTAKAVTKKAVAGKAAGNVGREVLEETLQEGTSGITGNVMLKEAKPETRISDNVGEGMVRGAVGGFAGGATVHAPRAAVELASTSSDSLEDFNKQQESTGAVKGDTKTNAVVQEVASGDPVKQEASTEASKYVDVKQTPTALNKLPTSKLEAFVASTENAPKGSAEHKYNLALKQEQDTREQQTALDEQNGIASPEPEEKLELGKVSFTDTFINGITAKAGTKEAIDATKLGDTELSTAINYANQALEDDTYTAEQKEQMSEFVDTASNVQYQRNLKKTDPVVTPKEAKSNIKVAHNTGTALLDPKKAPKVTPEQIEKATAGALIDNTAETAATSKAVLDANTRQIAQKPEGETFGSSTELEDALTANSAVVQSSQKLADASTTVNPEGRENLKKFYDETAQKLRNIGAAATKVFSTGDKDQMQHLVEELNVLKANKDNRLNRKGNTDTFKAYLKSEIAHTENVLNYLKANAKVSGHKEFADIDWEATPQPAGMTSLNEHDTPVQQRLKQGDTSTLSLNKVGRKRLLTGLKKVGVLDTIDGMGAIIASADLTNEERSFLGKVTETTMPADADGTLAKSTIAKLNTAVKNSESGSSTLAQYLNTHHNNMFNHAYQTKTVHDTTQTKEYSPEELEQSMGKKHIPETVQGSDFSEVQRLDKILQDARVDTSQFIKVGSVNQSNYKAAISQRVAYINQEKVLNQNTSKRSSPLNPTPKYRGFQGVLDKAHESLGRMFRQRNKSALIAKTYNAVHTLQQSNNASNALMNGLSDTDKEAVRSYAKEIQNQSDETVKGYVNGLSDKRGLNDLKKSLAATDKQGNPVNTVLNLVYALDNKGNVSLNQEALKELVDMSYVTGTAYGLTEGSSTSPDTLNDFVTSILKLGGNGDYAQGDHTFLNAGIPRALMVETLGKQFARTLGLGINDKATTNKDVRAALERDLGMFVMTNLEEAGYIKNQQYMVTRSASGFDYTARKAKKGELRPKSGSGKALLTMMRFDRDAMGDANLQGTNLTNYLSQLTNTRTGGAQVYTSAEEAHDRRTAKAELSKEHQVAIDTYREKGSKLDPEFLKAILAMDEDYLKEMLGIETDESQLLDIELEAHKSNVQTFNDVMQRLRVAAANPKDFETLFQGVNVSSNMRLNESSGLTGQGNKLVRALLHTFPETYTTDKVDQDAFKVAVTRSFDKDKLNLEDTVTWFDKRFGDIAKRIYELNNSKAPRTHADMAFLLHHQGDKEINTDYYRAAQIAKRMHDGETVSDEDRALIQRITAEGDLQAESFLALVSAGNYSSTESFQANVFLEDDGIANGVAISILMYGIKAANPEMFRNLHARVGVTLGEHTDINDFRSEAEKFEDMYEFFSEPTVANLNATGTAYIEGETLQEGVYRVRANNDKGEPIDNPVLAEEIDAIKAVLMPNDKRLAKVLRNYVKYPLMMLIYGAGKAALKTDIHQRYASELVKKVSNYHREYVNQGRTADARVILNEQLLTLSEAHAAASKLNIDTTTNTFVRRKLAAPHIKIELDKDDKIVFNKVVTKYVKGKGKTKGGVKAYPTPVKSTADLGHYLEHNVDMFLADNIVGTVLEKFSPTTSIAKHINEGTAILGKQYVQYYNRLLKEARNKDGFISVQADEDIKDKVDAAFPGVRSALSGDNENNSVVSPISTELLSSEREEDTHASLAMKRKGYLTNETKTKFKNRVGSGNKQASPLFIHSLDATAVIRALQADPNILQVFDGLVRSPKNSSSTDAANKAIHNDVQGEYHPIEALVQAIKHAKTHMEKDLNGGKETSLKTLLENEGTFTGKAFLDISGDTLQHVYTMDESLAHLEEQAKALKSYKAKVKALTGNVNQYNNVNGGQKFNQESLAKKTMKEVDAEIAKIQAEYDKALANSGMENVGSMQKVTDPNRQIVNSKLPAPTIRVSDAARKKALKERTEKGDIGAESDTFKTYLNQLENHLEDVKDDLSKLTSYMNSFFQYESLSLSPDEKEITNAILFQYKHELDDRLKAQTEAEAPTPEAKTEPKDNSIDFFGDSMFTQPANTSDGTELGNSPLQNVALDVTEERAETVIKSANVLTVFDELLDSNPSSEQAMSEQHTEFLRDLLSNLNTTYTKLASTISLTLNRRNDDGENFGTVKVFSNIADITLNLRNKVGSALSMSAQETFAHEFIHPFWKWGLEANRSILEEATRLFNQVVDNTPTQEMYKLFLNTDNPTPEDKKLAQERARHIFGGKGSEASLDEFLTIATTNEMFINNLKSQVVSKKPKTKGFFNHLGNLLRKVASLISPQLREIDTTGKTMDMAIAQLFIATQSTLNRRRNDNMFNKISDKVESAFDYADEGIKKVITPKILKDSVAIVSENHNISGNTEASIPRKIGDIVRKVANNNTENIDHSIRDIFSSIAGNSTDLSNASRLVASGTYSVDAVANRTRTAILNFLGKIGSREFTSDEHKQVTNVLGKTDLSVVMDYGLDLDDIVKLMDNQTLNQEVQNTTKELSKGLPSPHVNALVRHGSATAKYLVTGKTDEGSYNHNALFITRRVSKYIGKITDEARVARTLDLLITLQALQKTPETERQAIKQLLTNPATRPKLNALLAVQREVKKQALSDEFKGNNAVYHRKGHYTQVTDKNKGVLLRPISEKQQLHKQGYDLVETTIIPPNILGPSAQRVGIYVSPYGGDAPKSNSAYLSTQASRYGESLNSLLGMSGSDATNAQLAVNNKKYAQLAKDETEAFAKGQPLPSGVITTMHPVPNQSGEVGEFRMNVVDTAFKEKYLGLKHDLGQSYANTASRLSYRQQAPIHNKVVRDALVETFQKDYDKDPAAFYVLTHNSTNMAFKDAYNTIDPKSREALRKAFGDDKIYVKKNQYTAIFGYRMATVANLTRDEVKAENAHKELLRVVNNLLVPMLSNRFAVGVEHFMVDYVAELAKAIVVKSGAVATANLISNFLLTQMYGMNSLKTMQDAAIGITEGIKYMKLQEERQDLLTEAAVERSSEKPNLRKAEKLNQKANLINNRLKKSPVHRLVMKGHLTTVVADGAVNKANEFNTRGKLREKADKYFFNNVPSILGDTIKTALVLEDTQLFNAMQTATIMTDFGFKYAMEKHLEAQGELDENQIEEKIHHFFIGYEVPSPKPIAYLERSTGILMFTKFLLRSQRIVADIFTSKPARAINALIWQTAIAVSDTIYNSSYLLGNFGRLLHNVFTEGDAILNTLPIAVMKSALPD